MPTESSAQIDAETPVEQVEVSSRPESNQQLTIKEATVPSTSSGPAPSPAVAHRRLGHHELLEEIGRGGMGVVFRARHQILDRVFALKMMAGGTAAGMDEIERFLREARA